MAHRQSGTRRRPCLVRPASPLEHPPDEQRQLYEQGEFLEFSHSLETQIGGQIEARFLLAGLYEDTEPEEANDLLAQHMPMYIATRAIKPQHIANGK